MSPRKPAKRYVDTDAYLRAVARMLSAAANRVSGEDPEQLAELLVLEAELQRVIARAVHGMRRQGVTWADIGAATGTSRQAAQQRWGATA